VENTFELYWLRTEVYLKIIWIMEECREILELYKRNYRNFLNLKLYFVVEINK